MGKEEYHTKGKTELWRKKKQASLKAHEMLFLGQLLSRIRKAGTR